MWPKAWNSIFFLHNFLRKIIISISMTKKNCNTISSPPHLHLNSSYKNSLIQTPQTPILIVFLLKDNYLLSFYHYNFEKKQTFFFLLSHLHKRFSQKRLLSVTNSWLTKILFIFFFFALHLFTYHNSNSNFMCVFL